eukprot:CAMPEP_0182558462 /NCGR_PEP_ID=MMETSP1324-20130603/1978_1 /TAXON_ID=236786 /ORGANISM="Florenciella sp., Strain RCC1587" /LENGTH=141 /DNA_ID=CAMNT_0024770637 /DNA_START=23 /DNA_END=450 /DNA_ORIENTATION=+
MVGARNAAIHHGPLVVQKLLLAAAALALRSSVSFFPGGRSSFGVHSSLTAHFSFSRPPPPPPRPPPPPPPAAIAPEEDTNRIFSAEQIEVHPDLPAILKEYSKAVIRANPKDVVAFSAEYFRQKVGSPGEPIPGANEKADA